MRDPELDDRNLLPQDIDSQRCHSTWSKDHPSTEADCSFQSRMSHMLYIKCTNSSKQNILIYCFQKEGHKSALQGNAQHPIMEVKVTRQKRKTRRSHLHVKQTTVELKGIKTTYLMPCSICQLVHSQRNEQCLFFYSCFGFI